MGEARWICVRQEAGPLVKECRALRPRLSRTDSPEDRRDKLQIIKSQRTAVCRSPTDLLELCLALYGFRGSHYLPTLWGSADV